MAQHDAVIWRFFPFAEPRTMPSERPPTIDPVAAALGMRRPAHSPGCMREVARRMEGRLQMDPGAPAAWCDWDAVRGGLQARCAGAPAVSRCAVLRGGDIAIPAGSGLQRRWPSPGGVCRAGRPGRSTLNALRRVRGADALGPIWRCIAHGARIADPDRNSGTMRWPSRLPDVRSLGPDSAA